MEHNTHTGCLDCSSQSVKRENSYALVSFVWLCKPHSLVNLCILSIKLFRRPLARKSRGCMCGMEKSRSSYMELRVLGYSRLVISLFKMELPTPGIIACMGQRLDMGTCRIREQAFIMSLFLQKPPQPPSKKSKMALMIQLQNSNPAHRLPPHCIQAPMEEP